MLAHLVVLIASCLIPCFSETAVVFSVEISVLVLAHLVVLISSCHIPCFSVTAVVFSVEISVQALAHLFVLAASCTSSYILLMMLLC